MIEELLKTSDIIEMALSPLLPGLQPNDVTGLALLTPDMLMFSTEYPRFILAEQLFYVTFLCKNEPEGLENRRFARDVMTVIDGARAMFRRVAFAHFGV